MTNVNLYFAGTLLSSILQSLDKRMYTYSIILCTVIIFILMMGAMQDDYFY